MFTITVIKEATTVYKFYKQGKEFNIWQFNGKWCVSSAIRGVKLKYWKEFDSLEDLEDNYKSLKGITKAINDLK